MNKSNRKYTALVLIGLALWLAETAYFGWNDRPENGIEGALDIVSAVLIIWGVIGDITTNMKVVKHYHNITNTKKLNYIDQRVDGKNQLCTEPSHRKGQHGN